MGTDVADKEASNVQRARLAILARVMGWDVPDLTPEERRVADEKYEAAQAEARRIYNIDDRGERATP